MAHIEQLPPGPLAIIGDIHGEREALDDLLTHLDRDHGDHHLVFLGDLADRGPDSPGVIRRVRERMARGAQCILGNHELSVIREKYKKYNQWYFSDQDVWKPEETGQAPVSMALLPEEEREDVRAFFERLPLALERDDLRVVHACWDTWAIDRVRDSEESILELFDDGPKNTLPKPASLTDPDHGRDQRDPEWEGAEERQQNQNAIAVLTSGKERRARDPQEIVWSGNQWRPLVRVRWWDEYDEETPVVIGHYSRMWRPEDLDEKTKLMFPSGQPAGAPRGLRDNVYAIDYAVGARYAERHKGVSEGFKGRLGALLWDAEGPSRILFDDGEYGEVR